MKISGKIERSEVEGGQWILVTSKGDRYQLSGAIEALKDGMTAELTGAVDRNMMGFGMGGVNFVVSKVAPAAAAKPKAAKAKK